MSIAFARWTADDVMAALSRSGLRIAHAEPARWPPRAPQPTTHREAVAVYTAEVVDPHLVLAFATPEALEVWRLWLARYWKARPYLSVKDNVLLLVSRDVTPERAADYHRALARLRS